MTPARDEEDTRKVQTAVLGGANGHEPVFLPYEKEPARRLRQTHGADAFTCGVLLGGCGKTLTLRACDDRKSHFAHRPPVRCNRTALGENSADHLYIGKALARWLRGQGQQGVTVEYIRQKHARSDAIEIRFGPKKRRRLLHVQMARRSFAEWQADGVRLAAPPGKFPTIRMYGPESQLAAYELDATGFALRFRCETENGTRSVYVGTQPPGHKVEWTSLDRCRLRDSGILTPWLEETPAGIRLKRPERPAPAATGAPTLRKREESTGEIGFTYAEAAQKQTLPDSNQTPRLPRRASSGESRPERAPRRTINELSPAARKPRTRITDRSLPSVADALAARFTAAGFQLALVGVSVRDLLLHRLDKELEFATDADPRQALHVIRGWAETVLDDSVPSGTVTACKNVRSESYRLSINTYRSKPAGLPSGKELEDYLRCRGFTIDSMAIDLPSRELVDPCGGLGDMERRTLRTPIKPQASFSNDPLRILQASRYAAELDFNWASGMAEAVKATANRICTVDLEQLRGEFNKLILGPDPGKGLRLLVDNGVAQHFLPELPGLRMEIPRHHRHKDIFDHTMIVLQQVAGRETDGPDLVLRLAALLHDIGMPRTRSIEPNGNVHFHHHELVGAKLTRRRLRTLGYPKPVIDDVSRLVELHLRFQGYTSGEWTDSAVRRYVRDAGPLLDRLHKLTRADCSTQNRKKAAALARAYDALEAHIERLQAMDERETVLPDLDGHQIMEILGIRPGAEVGRAYEYMRQLRVERGPLSRDVAAAALRDWWAQRQRTGRCP